MLFAIFQLRNEARIGDSQYRVPVARDYLARIQVVPDVMLELLAGWQVWKRFLQIQQPFETFLVGQAVQRTRQIGLLKAMGASNGYILRDGIGQMAILVAAATVVGVAVGSAMVMLMGRGDAPVELSVPAVLLVVVSLVVAGVLGSLVAFRRVTQVEPAIALGVES